MNSNLLDETAIAECSRLQQIAQIELNHYLEAQAKANAQRSSQRLFALERNPLVPIKIEVERVGFTRNAAKTPYAVYKVDGRRCCTFIKRKFFMELIQILLKLKHGIEEKIRTITSSAHFGLNVTTPKQEEYITSSYLNKFFERYNHVALELTEPQRCDCNDLFDMCIHSIAAVLQPRLTDKVKPQIPPPLRYDPYAKGHKACAQSWKAHQ